MQNEERFLHSFCILHSDFCISSSSHLGRIAATMPLPILKVTNVVTPETLLRYFFQTERQWSGHLGEEANLDFGVAFTNAALPEVKDANRIFDVVLPEGTTPQQLFEQMELHFAERGVRCQEWLTRAPELAEWLIAHGFSEYREDILYLERLAFRPAGLPGGIQVLPARSSFRHARELSERMVDGIDEEVGRQLIAASMAHLDDPHYEALIAIKDGQAIAKVGVLTIGEIGRIEPLFVEAPFRRQGVGRMMMGRAIEICARSLFKHVFLSCMPNNDPAQALYRGLGFVKVGEMISYKAP